VLEKGFPKSSGNGMSSAIMHSSPAPLPPTESEKDVADEIVLNEDIAAADITHEGADAVHTVDGVSWTQEEERAIVRKMDWNIVPLVWALFMQVRVPVSPLLFPLDVCDLTLFSLFPRRLSFLDRSSESNAISLALTNRATNRTVTLSTDIGSASSIAPRLSRQEQPLIVFSPIQMQTRPACQNILA
jgi:hypothetical protein